MNSTGRPAAGRPLPRSHQAWRSAVPLPALWMAVCQVEDEDAVGPADGDAGIGPLQARERIDLQICLVINTAQVPEADVASAACGGEVGAVR